MSLCERANKRKHNMISKKSRYVELDSDEDEQEEEDRDGSDDECQYLPQYSCFENVVHLESREGRFKKCLHVVFCIFNFLHLLTCLFSSFTDAKKRHKKDHDKTWKHEEKRASGEHRRSGGLQTNRRGSGGRRRDWSSDDSVGGSPPPSLNDGKGFICSVSPFFVSNQHILIMFSNFT